MINETFEGLDGAPRDVCIVGSGPVGISLALELDRLGFSVLLLESGRLGADPGIQQLSAADIVRPHIHDDMSIAVSRQLGGTSNLWGAFCLPYDPVDFIPRPGLVDDAWPISYAELEPFYARACHYTRAGDPVFQCPAAGVSLSDDSFSIDTLERSASQQKLQVIHRVALENSPGIDVRLCATVVGMAFEADGSVGSLDVVRSDGSERLRVPVRNVVIAAGGLESTRLLLAAQRASPARFGGPDGPLGRYYMGHLIGDIADIEFASDALDRAFDYFDDGHGSYVRRRFVPSQDVQLREQILNVAMWPIVPPVADVRHGSAILSMIYLALAFEPLGRRLVAEAIRKRHIPREPVDVGAHMLNVLTGLPRAMFFSADFIWRRYFATPRIPGFFIRNKGRRYPLAYHSEQIPRPESRVTLSGDCDRTGLPKLRVDLRFHELDAKSVVRTHELLAAWLERTRLGCLHWRQPPGERVDAVLALAQHGTHQIGTIRMGSDRTRAVVDRNLRTFDAPNLFVASTAVMPTSGQANPTLTAVALAMRLAHDWKSLTSAPKGALASAGAMSL